MRTIQYFSEKNYKKAMETEVEPYLRNIMKSGYVNGENNVKIYYEKYTIKNAKGSIVISHGFSESLEKYKELIYYFVKSGFSVYGMDHRGHGRSGSLSKGYITQVNIDNFDFYISDLKKVLDEVVVPEAKGELILFGHSMGGCISGLFLERHPNYFKKAILNAPMMKVDTGDTNPMLARILAKVVCAVGLGDKYVPGHSEFSPAPDFKGAATACEPRYIYYHEKLVASTTLQRSGASYRWLKEAIKATKEVTNPINTTKIKIPVLLFQAERDTLVRPEGIEKFVSGVENCKKVYIKEAKHEIYIERDFILFPYLDRVLSFINEKY